MEKALTELDGSRDIAVTNRVKDAAAEGIYHAAAVRVDTTDADVNNVVSQADEHVFKHLHRHLVIKDTALNVPFIKRIQILIKSAKCHGIASTHDEAMVTEPHQLQSLTKGLGNSAGGYDVGDRIKVFISEVKSGETRGPIVTLSRIHPNFVKRLFELEIPEIQDGTIVIKGIAREAGSRTKIAVESRDENVEAVGSCIGKNGMRISAILDELAGEKIDIIKYSDDICEFVAEALSPAKVLSVTLEEERVCRVTVSPDQLSLAIGKEGQNAKLVARLTGCKIDIKA